MDFWSLRWLNPRCNLVRCLYYLNVMLKSDAFVLLKTYVVLGQGLMNFKNLFLSKLSELCMVNLAKEIWYKRGQSSLIFIIFLSWFVFLYINDYLMVKSQSAFWILPSLTFEIVKSQMEEKQKSIILRQFFLFSIL